MGNVKILDCTLRDGGYVNSWNFGKNAINAISKNLADAGVDIIEIGFLTDLPHSEDDSLFSSAEELSDIVKAKQGSMLAGMIALGEKEISPFKLADSGISGLDVIRITFHNSEAEISRAITYAEVLRAKGYKVCMQPVGTTSYSDEELVGLIKKINNLQPYAFYLVDTLGTLYKDELMHFVELIDKNLSASVRLGFHSHNNLQMSFSNAQLLSEYKTDREIIIDSSLYGMGRGAGNLCTELITRYLNESHDKKYDLVHILDAIDNQIYPLSLKFSWGYNAHYYMSAIHNCHPNYASYLMNMQTLTMNEVNLILQNLPKDNRHIFNKQLIESLYLNFQKNNQGVQNTTNTLSQTTNDEEVLVIAPGHTLLDYKDTINAYIQKNHPVVVSINTVPENFDVDYLFVSNRKRLMGLNYDKPLPQIIITSNLPKLTDEYICVDFDTLCDPEFEQPDNAGMMLLRLMVNLGMKKAILAGFDGFDVNSSTNYYTSSIADHNTSAEAVRKNQDIAEQIQKISESIKVEFLTPSKYEELINGKQKI